MGMLEFDATLSVGDALNAVLLVTAGVGILLTYGQLRTTHKTTRATFLMDLFSALYRDAEVMGAFYKVEYGEFVYDPQTFHGSEDERKLDRLLNLAELVCQLHAKGIITQGEMAFFEYWLVRLYENTEVRKYIEFLREWEREARLPTLFSALEAYCNRRAGLQRQRHVADDPR